jgi:hypothetical protein
VKTKLEDKSGIETWKSCHLKKIGRKEAASHRSTTYPCFLPDLGDSAGAGRAASHKDKSIFI